MVVNDASRRRLPSFDSTLKNVTAVADGTVGRPGQYGARAGGLLACAGDSCAFVDMDARALVVIDPTGKFARVMSPPKASDMHYLTCARNMLCCRN